MPLLFPERLWPFQTYRPYPAATGSAPAGPLAVTESSSLVSTVTPSTTTESLTARRTAASAFAAVQTVADPSPSMSRSRSRRNQDRGTRSSRTSPLACIAMRGASSFTVKRMWLFAVEGVGGAGPANRCDEALSAGEDFDQLIHRGGATDALRCPIEPAREPDRRARLGEGVLAVDVD